ncbi:replication initiator [Marine gokushovirus]|nr:replication initiator [Marine gokushovirus]
MACYHPLLAFRSEGKITFNKPFPFAKGFNLPCGQCVGCRLEYSRQWAVRLVHENQMHKKSCFITLTFNQEELDKRSNPASVDVRDFQLFMKRLRKKHKKIRFFHCGEYGEQNKRPHYHALIFGYEFPDRKLWTTRNKQKYYRSEELENMALWPCCDRRSNIYKLCICSSLHYEKTKGKNAETHYYNPQTGEVIEPEYCTMSRKPGIGYEWFKQYKTDVYPNDYCVINGKKIRPPRYYDNLLSEEELEEIKNKRKENAPEVYAEYDERMDRLFVQEQVKITQLQRLIRDI